MEGESRVTKTLYEGMFLLDGTEQPMHVVVVPGGQRSGKVGPEVEAGLGFLHNQRV